MTGSARYDAVADFYAAGWSDDLDDPVSACLLDLLGVVDGRRVLEMACGHGRITRELARRGAGVVGVDVSGQLIDKATAEETRAPLGIRYIHADVTEAGLLEEDTFDAVVCGFGLSDIDDLDGALATAHRVLRPAGIFVFSILHPCFPGGTGVSGSWPSDGSYHDEGWWQADGSLSTLRQQVGANHRSLSTYLNTFRRHGLVLDETVEPSPPEEWAATRPEVARFPVYWVARCVKETIVGSG